MDTENNRNESIAKENPDDFVTDGKLLISIPEFSTSQEHCVYYVSISYERTAWTIFRRYSQFNQLHSALISCEPSISTTCPLPKKTYLSPNPKGKVFLEKRRLGLETYLRTLIKIPNILLLADLQSFLGINEHLNVSSRNLSRSMEEFKWVHRTGGAQMAGGRSILQSPKYNTSEDFESGNYGYGCQLL